MIVEVNASSKKARRSIEEERRSLKRELKGASSEREGVAEELKGAMREQMDELSFSAGVKWHTCWDDLYALYTSRT